MFFAKATTVCLLAIFSLIFVSAMTLSPNVQAQVLDDRANMKILKTRSKLATGSSTYVYSGGQLDALADLEDRARSRVNCGSVDIANQSVDSNFAGEINIIIAGDIVNTGNNCR